MYFAADCPKGAQVCIGAAEPILNHLRGVWIALIVGVAVLALATLLLGLMVRRRVRRKRSQSQTSI